MNVLVVGGMFLGVVFAPQFGWNRAPDQALNGAWIFAGPTVRGSGNVISQSRQVLDFTAIHVDYPATVIVRQGASESLTIEAEDNVAASIRTVVTSHVLQIDTVRERGVFVTPTRPVRIVITAKDLN